MKSPSAKGNMLDLRATYTGCQTKHIKIRLAYK